VLEPQVKRRVLRNAGVVFQHQAECGKVYVGDSGTAIVLDCGVDISTATLLEIAAQKPDNSTALWTAASYTSTSLRYLTLITSLDIAGTWKLQAVVTLPGEKWRGETVQMTVYAPFS
jgi:hypothetical protein